MGTAWRCNAVDHKVDGAVFGFDQVNRFGLDGIGEGISNNAVGFEALLCCGLLECGRVIPACRSRTGAFSGFIEEDADGIRSCTESGSNP
ncbi:hypothetical protein D3C74_443130 [compost metagenome]